MFGMSPQQAANRAVASAKASQQTTIRALRRQVKGQRKKLGRVQEKLSTLTGATPQQATQAYSQDFYGSVGNIGQQYAKQVATFDPNIIASESAKRFAGVLSASMKDYTNRLNAISQQGSARMYQALQSVNSVRFLRIRRLTIWLTPPSWSTPQILPR
jgi:uncharacterized coiled-coil protein SlyX